MVTDFLPIDLTEIEQYDLVALSLMRHNARTQPV